MGFFVKFIARVATNGIALYLAKSYFSGFILGDGKTTLVIAAVVLALLNAFLRPILKLVFTPLIWITLGLFNVVISLAILWLADQLLTQLTITNFATLFWVSLIVAVANLF